MHSESQCGGGGSSSSGSGSGGSSPSSPTPPPPGGYFYVTMTDVCLDPLLMNDGLGLTMDRSDECDEDDEFYTIYVNEGRSMGYGSNSACELDVTTLNSEIGTNFECRGGSWRTGNEDDCKALEKKRADIAEASKYITFCEDVDAIAVHLDLASFTRLAS